MKTALLLLILTFASSAFALSQVTVEKDDFFIYNTYPLRVNYVSPTGTVIFSDGDTADIETVRRMPKLTVETPQSQFLHRTIKADPHLNPRSDDTRDILEIAHITKVVRNKNGVAVAYELSGIDREIVEANDTMKVKDAWQTMQEIRDKGRSMNVELHTQAVEATEIAKATGKGGKYPDWKGVLADIDAAKAGATEQTERRFRGMDTSVIDFESMGEESARDVGGRR